ncbi:MAG: hypothetical protein ACOYM4_17735 [Nodosilinea sp.]|jgi:hypothetical protein
MLLPADPQLPLSPRARRLVKKVAVIIAVGCFLGLLAMRVGA